MRTIINKEATDIDLQRKLYSFLQLKQGWHFGEGELIKIQALYKANEFIEIARNFPEYKIEIFPLIDGGINLSFMLDVNDELHAIELIINPDLSLDLKHEIGFGENYKTIDEKENAMFEDVYMYLQLTYIQCLSESFPTIITTALKDDIKVLPFATVLTMEASPLLTSTAYLPTITQSVAI